MYKHCIFILVALLVICFAVPAFAYTKDDDIADKHLPGESDPRPSLNWSFIRDRMNYLNGTWDRYHWSNDDLASCPICGAPERYWTASRTPASGYPYNAYFKCSACGTNVHYYSPDELHSSMDGLYGSPFLGHFRKALDSILDFCGSFLSFISSNWFTLVVISIPLIGIGLTVVFRLRRSV